MEMKQKLLTDIELDVHELKFLMDTFSKAPTQTLIGWSSCRKR